jgi:hypothetical protein
MALGDSYATTAELKTRMQVTGSTDDTQLAEALSTASREIEKYCARQFNDAATATARVFYPDNCEVAFVDDFHTTSGLLVKTDQGDDGTYETSWASTDYQLEPLNQIVDGETGWPYFRIRSTGTRTFPLTGYRAPLQVTARWGWAAVPAGVKQACLIRAEELFKFKDAPFGVAGFADYGAVRIKENPYVCKLLQPYRRNPVNVG